MACAFLIFAIISIMILMLTPVGVVIALVGIACFWVLSATGLVAVLTWLF